MDVPCPAALRLRQPVCPGAATARVIPVAPVQRARDAREPTVAAAHQGAEQVVLHGIVARREPLILRQLRLYLLELRLAHQRRHVADEDPRFRRERRRCPVRVPQRVGRRAADPGRAIAVPLRVQAPGVRRIAQDAADARQAPAVPPTGRRHAPRIEQPTEPAERHARLQVEREHLRDDRRLGRIDRHAAGIARPVRRDPVPVGRVRPRQQRARLELAQPAAPHPLRDQRALVFCDRPADLQQELIVRVITHRPIQELDRTARMRELLEEDHLVYVVAREPVGRGDQHAIDLVPLRRVTQTIQPRPGQRGPTVAVVAEDVALTQGPPLGVVGLHVGAQPLELLITRLQLRLEAGRDAGVDRDMHWGRHAAPPRGATRSPRRPTAGRGSWPGAAGAGRRDPSSAAPRLSARPSAGPATGVAWLPPRWVLERGG
jgi:hypothetical protein